MRNEPPVSHPRKSGHPCRKWSVLVTALTGLWAAVLPPQRADRDRLFRPCGSAGWWGGCWPGGGVGVGVGAMVISRDGVVDQSGYLHQQRFRHLAFIAPGL